MKGRVPGARLIPLGDLARRVKKIDRNRRVYVICQAGVRSCMAQQELRAMGFDNIINVVGGFKAWKSAGFPVEHG